MDQPVMHRFWRSRRLARIRHTLARPSFGVITRVHAKLIRWSGGRMRRTFLFGGGMPVLVLTTVGRKTGKQRTNPLTYLEVPEGFAVIASNAGNDKVPAWLLNLRAQPEAKVLVAGVQYDVTARLADPAEDAEIWGQIARANPGYDEYRNLTRRKMPVVYLAIRR